MKLLRVALPVFALFSAACTRVPQPVAAPLEIACPAKPAVSAAWYASAAPSEHGNDSRRTHSYEAACSTVSPQHANFVRAATVGLPGLYNMVTRQPGEVFALGGSFGDIATTGVAPYIAAIDARTMQLRWRTPLPGMNVSDWNYPGAMGVHANGDLYVVYGPHIARLDAASGAVKAHTDLPVNQPKGDVAYNGFVVLSDGRIVAKSIHRKPGCTAPDFKAFLACDTAGVAASTLALIDPDTLSVVQSLIAPEHIRFRTTATQLDGAEYVYMPGEERIRRYRYADGQLALDEGWSASYRLPGQTPGTAVAALGDWVVIQTNGIPTRTPLSIVAVSQHDAARQFRIEPFLDAKTEGSFIPSLPTVDEVNHRVYTFDGFAGEAAALQFDEASGFSIAWKARQRSFAFSALVGPPEARVLVGTDFIGWQARLLFDVLGYDNRLRLMRASSQAPKEAVVWRDAGSGLEIARSERVAAVAGSVPMPGAYGWLFVPDLHDGALLRFTPTAQ